MEQFHIHLEVKMNQFLNFITYFHNLNGIGIIDNFVCQGLDTL